MGLHSDRPVPLSLSQPPHQFSVKDLAEQFNAKPTEIKSLFRRQLDPVRARELQEQMLAAGLPL